MWGARSDAVYMTSRVQQAVQSASCCRRERAGVARAGLPKLARTALTSHLASPVGFRRARLAHCMLPPPRYLPAKQVARPTASSRSRFLALTAARLAFLRPLALLVSSCDISSTQGSLSSSSTTPSVPPRLSTALLALLLLAAPHLGPALPLSPAMPSVQQPPLASAAPIGNSQDPAAYLAGRAAAVAYAAEHGFPLECAVEIATAWGDQGALALSLSRVRGGAQEEADRVALRRRQRARQVRPLSLLAPPPRPSSLALPPTLTLPLPLFARSNVVPLRWCETGRGTFMRAVARDIADERVRADLNGSGRGKGVIFGEVRYRYLVRRAVFLSEERGGRRRWGRGGGTVEGPRERRTRKRARSEGARRVSEAREGGREEVRRRSEDEERGRGGYEGEEGSGEEEEDARTDSLLLSHPHSAPSSTRTTSSS